MRLGMRAWAKLRFYCRGWLFRLGEMRGLPDAGNTMPETLARASIEWILRAQNATPDGGVSESYRVREGAWAPSYPETTGYIICSLLRATGCDFQDRRALEHAARRMGCWLLTTQMADGAFPSGHIGLREKKPAVFNTGQIVKGLTDLIVHGLDEGNRFLDAARRAAKWLRDAQDADGAWRRHLSVLVSDEVQSYNVRTAWALARYGKRVGDDEAVRGGIRNAEWLCRERDRESGWFPHMNFFVGEDPLLHTVAYTINGLMEIGLLCGRSDFVDAARMGAEKVRVLQNVATGAIPGRISAGYRAGAKWTNTTANAQMAIVWFRQAAVMGDDGWRQAAVKANAFNCRVQAMDLNHPDPGRRGGLRGSIPGHEGYGRYWYMNWTQKFHLDALLAEMGVTID